MFITDIFKIVVHFDGSLDSVVVPRIFFDRQGAFKYAQDIKDEGCYDDKPIADVIIYREVPDSELGWFRTAGQTRV